MTLGQFEELAFQIHSICFLYMGPFRRCPFYWDYERSKLLMATSRRLWIPYFCIAAYTWLFAWTGLIIAVVFGYLCPRANFTFVNGAIFVLVWAILAAMDIVLFIGFQHKDAALSSVNQLLDIADKIEKEYPLRRRRQLGLLEFDLSITLPFALMPPVFVFPFVIAGVSVLSDVGVPYFLLEEVLPNPMYRSFSTVWFSLILRFMVVFLGFFEFARSISFFCCVFFIILDRGEKIFKAMMGRMKNVDAFYKYYIQCTLLLRKVETVVHTAVYLIMTIGFWALVSCCWVCVKGSIVRITFPLYMCFLTGFIFVLGCHVVLFPFICNDLEMSVYVVKLYRVRAEFEYAMLKTRVRKIRLMKVRSMQAIRIKYGPFWYLGEAFVAEYTLLIMLRCFDAILLVKF